MQLSSFTAQWSTKGLHKVCHTSDYTSHRGVNKGVGGQGWGGYGRV